MARIAGVDLPNDKRVDIGLTYLYGIGRANVKLVLTEAALDGSKRIKDLNDEEISRLARIVEKKYKVEGDLRQEISENIKRLIEIHSYRGSRHLHKLPSRGQRTRTNARTKRGKRMTIGALKKEDRMKTDTKAAPEAAAK